MARLKAFLFVFVVYLGSALALQIQSWNFDWDDNIFFMPTKIILFERGTGKELGVTTTEFATMRETIGKPGKYENYELRDNDATGSFREFRDIGGINRFKRDVEIALTTQPMSTWQAPSWRAFQKALSSKTGAEWTTIITARGHEPESMLEALKLLKAQGWIENLPPQENLYAVANPRLKGNSASPSNAKLDIMKRLLDRLQAKGLSGKTVAVVDQNGDKKVPLHLWGFSDDDFGNYITAKTGLAREVQKGKWKSIKIVLFFTGENHPNEQPRVEILKRDGTARNLSEAERSEIAEKLFVTF